MGQRVGSVGEALRIADGEIGRNLPERLRLRHRLQNTLTVFLGDARTGAARPVLVEKDSAWVDVVNDLRWLDGGKSFTWISERDGWRHLYVVSRDGKSVRLVTPGAFDVHNPASLFGENEVLGVDDKAGTAYFTDSLDTWVSASAALAKRCG